MGTDAETPPGVEPLRALPSGKFLFGLIQSVTDEVIAYAGSSEARYVILEQLWMHCKALAKARLELDDSDAASLVLRARWTQIDAACGEPVPRSWIMDHSEAVLRQEATTGFVYGTGMFPLSGGELDSPAHYLSKRELEVSIA